MDEPSSNLDEEAAESLGRMLARLKENGYAMLIAEHRLAYLMDVADRFLLVQDGRIAREMSREDVLALSDQQRLSWGLRDPKGLARPKLPRPAGRNAEAGQTPTPSEAAAIPPAPEAAPLLELRELAASYRLGPFRSRRIFESLSFSAASGQIIALTGENGVGKTTLARILAGLMRPKSGEVRVKGRRRRARELRKLAWYVPNDVKTEFFTPSVQEELMLLVEPDETHKDKARGLLRALGLWNMREQHPATLSGGQKQRLAIACGLMSDRPVLVLDEPTSGLDAINMELVSRTLETAAVEGRAVIVVTHDNEFLKRCCTHAYPMNPNGHAQPAASRTPA